MVTKAVVEEVIDQNHLRVRVPIYDRASSAINSVPTENLTIASICTPAGIQQTYVIGDVVYIAFEQDERGYPVVLGRLQTEELSSSTSDIKTDSITVSVNYKLPKENDSINYGANNSADNTVNQQTIALEQRIKDLETQLFYPVGGIMFTTINENPSNMRYSGKWEKAADSFVMKFNDANTPIFIWKKIEL